MNADQRGALPDIEYRIYPHLRLLYALAPKHLSFEQLVAHPQTFMKDPDFVPGIQVLYDFSEVEKFGGDMQVLVELSESTKSQDFIPVEAKTAIVVPAQNTHLYRMMEGYCLITQSTRVEHLLFDDLDKALAGFNCSREDLTLDQQWDAVIGV